MNRNRNATGNAKREYATNIAPVVEIVSSLFGLSKAEDIVTAGIDSSLEVTRKTQIQGALVSVDPEQWLHPRHGGRQAVLTLRPVQQGDAVPRAARLHVQASVLFRGHRLAEVHRRDHDPGRAGGLHEGGRHDSTSRRTIRASGREGFSCAMRSRSP